jgi:hypothetical protein
MPGRPPAYHPRITHQRPHWARELRRLHGRGQPRARRPIRRALSLAAVALVLATGILVVIVVLV